MIGGAAQNDAILLKNMLGSLGPKSDKNDYYILSDCEGISGIDDPHHQKEIKIQQHRMEIVKDYRDF